MMSRKFEESFKRMAVELSTFKGSVSVAAKELDMDPSLLSRWRHDSRYNGGTVCPITLNSVLRAGDPDSSQEIKAERGGIRDSKKGGRHLFQGGQNKYRFIKDHRDLYSVEKMCEIFEVSSSGFYYWLSAPHAARDRKKFGISDPPIRQATVRMAVPGLPRSLIKEDVRSRSYVARLMNEAGISSKVKRKYRITTYSEHKYPVAENLL